MQRKVETKLILMNKKNVSCPQISTKKGFDILSFSHVGVNNLLFFYIYRQQNQAITCRNGRVVTRIIWLF